MSATNPSRSDRSLAGALRRVAALSLVAGYVEIVGYTDVGGIYPGIMTGNAVQLGFALARAQWERFGIIGFAVGLFFVGAVIASRIMPSGSGTVGNRRPSDLVVIIFDNYNETYEAARP
jgi:uncharacterized membrane protein YoaK (UPF0700 family)